MIVLVPEFNMEAFPDVYAYNYGNVRPDGRDAAVLPREHWTFGIIDRLFKQVRDSSGIAPRNLWVIRQLSRLPVCSPLFWHSTEPPLSTRRSHRTVESICFPIWKSRIRAEWVVLIWMRLHSTDISGARLTILLGECDCDGTASDLPRNEEAMAQGPHRLARGLWHFKLCQGLATSCGDNLRGGWKSFLAQDMSIRRYSTALSVSFQAHREISSASG